MPGMSWFSPFASDEVYSQISLDMIGFKSFEDRDEGMRERLAGLLAQCLGEKQTDQGFELPGKNPAVVLEFRQCDVIDPDDLAERSRRITLPLSQESHILPLERPTLRDNEFRDQPMQFLHRWDLNVLMPILTSPDRNVSQLDIIQSRLNILYGPSDAPHGLTAAAAEIRLSHVPLPLGLLGLALLL